MRKVIYTVNVGGYDKLRAAPRFSGWETVLFSDVPPSGLRRVFGARGWRVLPLERGDGETPVLASRRPKLLPHHFLQDYDYSLYVDANIVFLADPSCLLEALDWPFFAAALHPYRTTPFAEVEACIAQKKAPADVLEAQAAAYRAAGFPEEAPLLENNVLLRRHNDPQAIALGEAWWEAFLQFPYRDQISLPFAAYRSGIMPIPFSQEQKRAVVAARSHDRSLQKRLKRSLDKRLKRWRGD